MIRFQCPHCRSTLKADEELAGRAIRCSHCQQKVRVPADAPASAGPAAAGRVICVCGGCKAMYAATSRPQPHRVKCPKCGTRMDVPGADQVTATGQTIRFACPKCRQAYCVLAKYAGKNFPCVACKNPCHVPIPPEPESAPAFNLQPIGEPPATATATGTPTLQSPSPDGLEPPPASAPTPDIAELDALAPDSPPPDWADQLEADLQATQQRKQTATATDGPALDVSALSIPDRVITSPSVDTGTDWRDRIEALPFIIRIPMGMLAGLFLAACLGIVWAIIARATGFIFCWLCVPIAAVTAYGLMPFVRDRNVGVGLFAAFLGFLGILIGKGLIAKIAVMPEHKKVINEKMDDSHLLTLDRQEAYDVLNDPNRLFTLVCFQLAEDGHWDQDFALYVIQKRHTGDPSEMPFLDTQPPPDPDRVDEAVALTQQAMDTWHREKLIQTAQRQHPIFVRHVAEKVMDTAPMRAFGAGVAFIASFAIWDLLMIPLALGTAFKIGNDS